MTSKCIYDSWAQRLIYQPPLYPINKLFIGYINRNGEKIKLIQKRYDKRTEDEGHRKADCR